MLRGIISADKNSEPTVTDHPERLDSTVHFVYTSVGAFVIRLGVFNLRLMKRRGQPPLSSRGGVVGLGWGVGGCWLRKLRGGSAPSLFESPAMKLIFFTRFSIH